MFIGLYRQGPNRTIKHFCRQGHSILGIRSIKNIRWYFYGFKDISKANIEDSLLSDPLKACNSGI